MSLGKTGSQPVLTFIVVSREKTYLDYGAEGQANTVTERDGIGKGSLGPRIFKSLFFSS